MSRGKWKGITRFGSNFAAVLAGILVMLAAAAAQPATTITVNSLRDPTDSGKCTLRDAIAVARSASPAAGDKCASNSGGPYVIIFAVTGTISLSGFADALELAGITLTINGPASAPGITIDAGNNYPVFVVDNGTFNVNNLTIANGNTDGNGGGIDNESGTLTVTNCTFTGNSAPSNESSSGGAIFNGGTATVANSTFSGNNAQLQGGGIFNSGTLTLTNSTFWGNTSTFFAGGGIADNPNATLNIKGTIFGSNGPNCLFTGHITNGGYNVSDDSTCNFGSSTGANGKSLGDNVGVLPLNAVLRANGGPTQTFALQTGSAAIDAIPFASCTFPLGTFNPCTNPPALTTSDQLTCDQRGQPRPDPEDGADGPCDIGAYEFQGQPGETGAPVIDCSTAVASNPNLTALLPVMFFPEYIFGVNDQARAYTLEITGVVQDKQPTGFPLCPNAFWSGTTTYVRTNNEPLQGPGPLLYQIEFTATDNATGQSCMGAAPVCVKGLFQSQSCPAVSGAIDATKCP